eukprot:scaffold21906_cov63-Phaeocystis_antarctica.AAC.2
MVEPLSETADQRGVEVEVHTAAVVQRCVAPDIGPRRAHRGIDREVGPPHPRLGGSAHEMLAVTVVPDLKLVAGIERHQAAAVRCDPKGQLLLLPGLSDDERRGIIVFERGVHGWLCAERCARVLGPHTWRRHVHASELLRSAVVARRLPRA